MPRQFRKGASIISIGRYTYGHEHMSIREWGEGAQLKIGAFCSLASAITIFLGGNHRVDWATTFPFGHIFTEELGGQGTLGHPATKGDVVIGNDVWIAHGATIMSGVTIGDGAVIGANATVTRDVRPYSIVAGNPSKIVRARFDEEITTLLLKLRWWDLPLETIRYIIPDLSRAPTKELLTQMVAKYRG